MTPTRFPGSLALAALLALPARAALAGVMPTPMMPLDIGTQWEYASVSGVHEIETITGTRVVLGRTVFVKSFSSGPDNGIENWWQTGPAGEVLLAGFDRHDGFTLGYDPPITLCGGTPTLGDLWPTHIIMYDMATMNVVGEYDFTFGALEDVSLTVPAGTFHCYGVGQVVPVTAKAILGARGLTLDGRRAATGPGAAASSATDWFSSGVGAVQTVSSDLFQLVSFSRPTPTLTSSWGRLKQLYR